MRVPVLTVAVFISSVGLEGCSTMAVAPGHRAVLQTPSGELLALGEGAVVVEPGAVLQDFDVREQSTGRSVATVTADGVPVVVRFPVATWAWVADEVVDGARELGSEGARSLVASTVGSAISQVLSTYAWGELDPPHLREAEARITERAAAALRPRHLVLSSVALKGVTPRAPQLAAAITDTAVWQERSATAGSRLEVAKQRADAARAGAQGFADAMGSLEPTLTREVLDREADRAWARLLASPRTTVEVSYEVSPALEVAP